MTPFQQFRVWARRAPLQEKAFTALTGVLLVGLLAWILIPVTEAATGTPGGAVGLSGAPGSTAPPGGSVQPSNGALPTVPPGTPPPGSAGVPAAGSVGRPSDLPTFLPSSGPSAGPTGSRGCVSPPGTDQGITAKEVHVAVVLINLLGPAGNSTFGLPSVEEQQQDYQLVADDLNKRGGVACRKLVLDFHPVNPVDTNNQQQTCLEIKASKPFFVVDPGGYQTTTANCFPQSKLPYLAGAVRNQSVAQFYPYLFGSASFDVVQRNGVYALRSRGFFSKANGFNKLGFIYRSCFPDMVANVTRWLKEVGVPSNLIVTYDGGCPNGFASPADLQQAVLKFKSQGVTHVTEAFFVDFANFTKIAQQQQFKPRYGLFDDGIIATSYGSLRPNYDNIAGALNIVASRYGEETTPGAVPTPGTKRCNAIFTAKGRPTVYKQPVGFGGLACSHLWMVAAAIDHAPALQRNRLAEGLQAAKSVDLPFPSGPNSLAGSRVTYGGQLWRPVAFVRDCSCWRLIDATYRPGFA